MAADVEDPRDGAFAAEHKCNRQLRHERRTRPTIATSPEPEKIATVVTPR